MDIKLSTILILIGLFLWASGSPSYSQTIFIPTTDPVNDDIQSLIAQGFLNELNVSERPWLVSEVIAAILDNMSAFDQNSKKQAEFVLEHLKPTQKASSDRLFGNSYLGLEFRGLSRERREGYFLQRSRYFSRDFKAETGSAFNAGYWISREGSWGIDTRLIFDTDGTDYPWYYGRAHNSRIIGQFDHAYLIFDFRYFAIFMGRQRFLWGSSPRGSLLIDDGSPPMDKLSFKFDLKPFRMSWFTARIDDYYDLLNNTNNRRFLAGHMLTLNTGKGWEVSLSEVVLYGGVERLPELYYSIPVTLFYWEAYNRSLDDNTFWTIETSWNRRGLGRFYLQFVSDDFQYKNRGPQKFAFQIGSHLEPSGLDGWKVLLELNIVDKYVYGHRKRLNSFLNWGDTIGRLDSDQLELFVGLYREIAERNQIGLEYVNRGKGEYYAEQSQIGALPRREKFPSGIAEKTNDIRMILKWHVMKKLEIGNTLGYQNISNYNHVRDESFGQFFTLLDISYFMDFGLPYWGKLRQQRRLR